MKGFFRSRLALTLAAFLMIAAAVVVSLSGSLGSAQVFASDPTGTRLFIVPATAGDAPPPTTWVDTGFDLIPGPGHSIMVTATGIAQFCPTPGLVGGGGCSTTPDGPFPGSPAGSTFPPDCTFGCPIAGAPIGTLIAKVGTALPVVVGSASTLTGSGRLLFAYNDGFGAHFDNSGKYDVTITFQCQPGNGFGDDQHYHCPK